jgi:hypothetical protein
VEVQVQVVVRAPGGGGSGGGRPVGPLAGGSNFFVFENALCREPASLTTRLS